MESFVLNLFSDQLSKIILNFHQSTINANFLSGKGSIKNVKLNVGLINDFLNKPPHGTVPFLEFTEITLTELRVEVTSYTNLKKAPIVLVIEEIHAKARETMEYHVDNPANAQKKAVAAAAKNDATTPPLPHPQKKSAAPSQPYSLLHRILDNLSVKIKRIHLSFSPLGKFKTRRRGIWTPPSLQVSFDNVEWICVTETGNPGTPDMVWAHNELSAQQSRFKREATNKQQRQHRSYIIYKRLSMLCHVKLLPSGDREQQQTKGLKFNAAASNPNNDSEESISTLMSSNVDVHLAYIRRLRDAGVTGADLDIKVHDVDINLDVTSYNKTSSSAPSGCDLGAFVHMLVGLLHCYYKDRSFVDPLLPEGVSSSKTGDGSGQLLRGFGSPGKEEEVEAGPDDFLPEVAMMDDDLDSSDESDYEEEPDEEHDKAFLDWKRKQDQEEGIDSCNKSVSGERIGNEDIDIEQSGGDGMKMSTSKGGGNDETPAKSYKRKRKAVIVVASGAQKFEKLSFSLSIPRINMKLCLPSEEKDSTGKPRHPVEKEAADSETYHHCLELLLEGLVAECIWPKKSGEMGGHVQGSVKYFHLFESAYRTDRETKSGTFGPKPWNVVKIFPLIRIGRRMFQGHDVFSLSSRVKGSQDAVNSVSKCDEFPLMENRETTWRWDRQLKGPRALALKSTISFLDDKLTRWSKTNIQHEASLGELELVLDSAPLERLITLFSDPRNEHNLWFDDRWLSGEWQAEISDIIAVDESDFCLKDHLQPLPSLYPSSKQSPLSSELRSVTAHLDSITIRLPNPMQQDLSSIRMADVVFSISEATILLSSDLPSSFLSGVVAAENSSHEFPHDPSDISCVSAVSSTDMSSTKFRLQISLSNCSLKVMPAQVYGLSPDERGFSNLVAPTNVTMIMSLEHKNAKDSPNDASRSLILSVLIHQLESNIELRSVYGALETLKYHAASLVKEQTPSDQNDENIPTKSKPADETDQASNSSSIICIHVPEVDINLWGQDTHQVRPLKTSETETFATQIKHTLLCQVKASQFEFGMESAASIQAKGVVFKCAIASVLVVICSPVGDDDANFKMVEILSMGCEASDGSHLVKGACDVCFDNDGDGLSRVSKKKNGFLLRSENESAEYNIATSANAIEISSPLAVDLNITAIEFFLNHVVECLLAPVFVGSRNRFNQIGQTALGSALWSIVSQLYSLFASPHILSENAQQIDNSLFRLSLYQLLLLVPSIGESEDRDSFGLIFGDVEVAAGSYLSPDSKDTPNYQNVIEKRCGHGRTWANEFYPMGKDSSTGSHTTFYALRSKHALLNVGCPRQVSNNDDQFKVIIPQSSINWSLPVGNAPPFDIFALKDLSLSLMNLGMPLSSVYFKLYKLSPQNESEQSDFSLAATRLHDSVGSYHCKMQNIVGQMNAEVDRLRKVVFAKERERIGALALVSSTSAGWIRVGEDLSFSHRIFSSATFFQYWMVLSNSLLILYKAPGTRPSNIIPLRASSQLRSISMSSSSSKATSGIVGNHMTQKGFAVFDSADGTRLFFVAANDSDYSMWVEAISVALVTSTAPDNIPAKNAHGDNIINQNGGTSPSTIEQVIPPPSALNGDQIGAQVSAGGLDSEHPLGVFAPPQAPNHDHFVAREPPFTYTSQEGGNERIEALSDDPVGAFDVLARDTAEQEEISPTPFASLDSSELGDDVDMEDVSLGDSENSPNDFSAFNENVSSAEIPLQQPTQPEPRSPIHEPQNINSQSLPMRERLAMAKGKSKMATSRFGSALKTAKGGVLAASEISRDGIKQAMAKETPRRDEPTRRVGQKMSMLKTKANTKLTAARSSMQVLKEDASEPTDVSALPSTSSRDELLGNRKLVVGQKMSLLKKNASTKLTSLSTSVRSSMQDQLEVPLSSSQDELSANNRSSKQELRNKLANLDQSMSNTMRRLKIDEKVNQFSAAVKSGVKNDPVVRQLSNVNLSSGLQRNSEHSRLRLRVGEDSKSIKPIKFDARETFSASSELPLKVKSVSCNDVLSIDDTISERVKLLRKIGGSWVVAVDDIKVVNAKSLISQSSNNASPAENLLPSIDPQTSQDDLRKYRITATDLACETDENVQATVERTMGEMLVFHTQISEMIANHLPSTSEVFQEELADSRIFEKISPVERLKVSGTILQGVLEVDNPSSTISSSLLDKRCELIKVVISTILECYMPEEAIAATKLFLKIDNAKSDVSDDYGTFLTEETRSVDEAFDLVSNAATLENEPLSQTNSSGLDPKCDRAHSSLLNVIMDGYSNAIKERDEALASLATTSIINDNRIMQEQLARSNQGSQSRASNRNSSDDDMLNLCKQLGNEIASRTAAETEVNRLNECLEFERKVAQAKEKELQAELARYKTEPN